MFVNELQKLMVARMRLPVLLSVVFADFLMRLLIQC